MVLHVSKRLIIDSDQNASMREYYGQTISRRFPLRVYSGRTAFAAKIRARLAAKNEARLPTKQIDVRAWQQ